jgi:hypothetical protein
VPDDEPHAASTKDIHGARACLIMPPIYVPTNSPNDLTMCGVPGDRTRFGLICVRGVPVVCEMRIVVTNVDGSSS